MTSSVAQHSETSVITAQELALRSARPETRILFFCAATFIAGIVQGFRAGWNTPALALILGAVVAIVGMLKFTRAIMSADVPQSVAGMAPYLFGCYLVFIRGLWSARALLNDFQMGGLLAAVAFVFAGYRIVFWTWQLTELAAALRTGKLKVIRAA